MAKNKIRTSKSVASKASSILRGRYSKKAKSVAGSALSNRRRLIRQKRKLKSTTKRNQQPEDQNLNQQTKN